MKEFYSKVCVVEIIKFFADELSESELNLTKTDKFTCNLATILAARDKEVVTVYLNYLSNKTPKSLSEALESDNLANLWIKVYGAFIKYASIDIKNIDKVERSLISIICCCFYKKVKDDPTIPKKFLGRIKKPVAVNQSIFSWKNIIQRLPMNKLDNENIVQKLYLHAEMNILTNIINQKDKSKIFIAAHKKIYHRWKLPDVKDNTFKKEFLIYILEDLNLIIKGEIEQFTSIFADSDSEGTEDVNFESAMDFGHMVIHSHEI
ncbi:hypothetical protein C1645_833945 [Glomus cerebriforme]|uniref:Uncharacterized protein n=1 Tax=Glomus cerebriforme TaxID=658196 RepID=A0A397SER1_9GLOM|nr:hypothetical protein C1645_833945 [Glomus cerebriforme]